MSALDVQATARRRRQIDDALEAATRLIDENCHRPFYPQISTRYFDWPNNQLGTTWRLWLDDNEIVSVTQITTGGVTLDADEYLLGDPNENIAPPYDRVEINLGTQSSAAFQTNNTFQRSIVITGTFGWPADDRNAGALSGSINDSATSLTVSSSADVGVGDLILIGDERMVVTEKRQVDTGLTIAANVADATTTQSITVSGAGLAEDETILIDGEKMVVTEIAGSMALVVRAQDGTALAAHTSGAAIYAPRTLEVDRGAAGTTAVSHTDTDVVYVHKAPAPIRELCRAFAIMTMLNEPAGYARTAGSGDNERQVSARNVILKAEEIYDLLGRGYRLGAV